jgi:hypothetical protein
MTVGAYVVIALSSIVRKKFVWKGGRLTVVSHLPPDVASWSTYVLAKTAAEQGSGVSVES